MTKILFVCHGNICRSPMAEFVMKRLVAELHDDASLTGARGETGFEIASAATSTEEIGNPVYPPARRMLNAHGIDCSRKRARQMTARDYEYYDYIVLMDRNNLRNLRWILPADVYERETAAIHELNFASNREHSSATNKQKISLLMDWTGTPRDVADPWYTGNFDATWSDVNEGCSALLDAIIKAK